MWWTVNVVHVQGRTTPEEGGPQRWAAQELGGFRVWGLQIGELPDEVVPDEVDPEDRRFIVASAL